MPDTDAQITAERKAWACGLVAEAWDHAAELAVDPLADREALDDSIEDVRDAIAVAEEWKIDRLAVFAAMRQVSGATG